MTHPFHPLSGRRLACVGERYNRYGKRLLLRVDKERICSVPPQWTDVAAPDPEIVLGAGRAALRLADLLELAELIERLQVARSRVTRQDNYAASVKMNTPQSSEVLKGDPGSSRSKRRSYRGYKLDDGSRTRRK